MVSSIINTALTGLQASSVRLNNSANNVANLNTVERPESGIEAYRATDVQQTSLSETGGTRAVVRERDPATITIPDGNGGTTQAPNVSLEEEIVQQQISTYTFEANLRVIQAADEMADDLTDILA